jgi:hypothetical protein
MLAEGDQTSSLQGLDCPDTLSDSLGGLFDGQVSDYSQ